MRQVHRTAYVGPFVLLQLKYTPFIVLLFPKTLQYKSLDDAGRARRARPTIAVVRSAKVSV